MHDIDNFHSLDNLFVTCTWLLRVDHRLSEAVEQQFRNNKIKSKFIVNLVGLDMHQNGLDFSLFQTKTLPNIYFDPLPLNSSLSLSHLVLIFPHFYLSLFLFVYVHVQRYSFVVAHITLQMRLKLFYWYYVNTYQLLYEHF